MSVKTKIFTVKAILGLLILFGLFLRLYHLGVPSLARDELSTVFRINYPFFEIIKNLSRVPLFPPLYYTSLKLWVDIFGNSEFSVRFLSLIFSVLSIPLVYLIGKDLFNKRVGVVAALFLTFSPYSINYAQEAKMYSMLWFFTSASFLFFYRIMRENRRAWFWLYIITATLSIYTMYIGFLFIAVQNMIFLFLFFDKNKLKKWFLGQGIIILFFLPWMFYFIFQIINKYSFYQVGVANSYGTFLKQVFFQVTGSAFGRANHFELFLYVLLLCFACIEAMLIFLRHKFKRWPIQDQNHYFIFLWMLVPVIIYFLIYFFDCNILQHRYLGFVHIPLMIIFAVEIDKFNLRFRVAAIGFLLVSIIYFHLFPYYQHGLKIGKENWRELCAELDKKVEADDLIFLINSDMGPMKYYLKHANVFEDYYSDNFFSRRIKINGGGNSVFVVYKFKKFLKWYKLEAPTVFYEGFKLAADYNYGDIGFLYFTKENNAGSKLTDEKNKNDDVVRADDIEWNFSNGKLDGKIKINLPSHRIFEGRCKGGFKNCMGSVYLINGLGAKEGSNELVDGNHKQELITLEKYMKDWH